MNLLNRYLQAVGMFLPVTTRDDVLAELRANLRAQMDDREEELNRPLTEADISAILQAHGKPEVVAVRYLPQRSLIGPSMFPFYLLTLRRALPLVLLIYTIAAGARLVAASSGPWTILLQAAAQLIPTLLMFWSIVTIIFAALDYAKTSHGATLNWNTWDPAKLPPLGALREAKPKSLGSRIADLVVHCLWMAFVFAIPAHPFLVLGPGTFSIARLGATFAPVWHTFYELLVVLLVLQLVMKILALAPGVHGWLKPMEIATKVLGVVFFCVLLTTSTYFLPQGQAADLHTLATVNHWMGVAFRIALFFAVLDVLQEVWKWVKPRVQARALAF